MRIKLILSRSQREVQTTTLRTTLIPYRSILDLQHTCGDQPTFNLLRSCVQFRMLLYGRGTENRTLVCWLKASYFTTKLYPQTEAYYCYLAWTLMIKIRRIICFCLAGGTRIELVLLESKSSVLPLHQPPTKSRIVKEHFSTMAIKQKTLWIFISEGLVSKLKFI